MSYSKRAFEDWLCKVCPTISPEELADKVGISIDEAKELIMCFSKRTF